VDINLVGHHEDWSWRNESLIEFSDLSLSDLVLILLNFELFALFSRNAVRKAVKVNNFPRSVASLAVGISSAPIDLRRRGTTALA
jgi:hypothetical protein